MKRHASHADLTDAWFDGGNLIKKISGKLPWTIPLLIRPRSMKQTLVRQPGKVRLLLLKGAFTRDKVSRTWH